MGCVLLREAGVTPSRSSLHDEAQSPSCALARLLAATSFPIEMMSSVSRVNLTMHRDSA